MVVTDEPITMWSAPRPEDQFLGRGIATSDEIRLPLDRSHMLFLTGERPPVTFAEVSDPYVTDMNRLSAASAHEWVFTHPGHPSLDQIVTWAREAPFQEIHVHDGGKTTILRPGVPRSAPHPHRYPASGGRGGPGRG